MKMLDLAQYNQIKKKYGKTASWAIWANEGKAPKSHTDDLSVFNNVDIYKKLNPNYVLVGLNPSVQDTNEEPWRNFHSTDTKRQNDYKLRYTLQNTKFWGAYITDLNHKKETNSNKVTISDEDIYLFKHEIALLGTKPVLIALGNKVYEALSKYLSNEYKIVKIQHFACYISKEAYRESVLKELTKI